MISKGRSPHSRHITRQEKTRQDESEGKRRQDEREDEREEKRREEKRREEKRREEKRREEKRRGEEIKMEGKRRETKEDMILLKSVSNQKNPPDELAQHVSRKIPFGRFFQIFLSKFQNLTAFSIIT